MEEPNCVIVFFVMCMHFRVFMHALAGNLGALLLTLGAHAHSEGYSSCRVCVCVCMCVCVYV